MRRTLQLSAGMRAAKHPEELAPVHAGRSYRSRIPGVIWATLYLVASLAMAGIGYHEGPTSLRRSPAVVILILAFSAVMNLIADLDRPHEGLFNVSQQAMVDLRNLLDETRR